MRLLSDANRTSGTASVCRDALRKRQTCRPRYGLEIRRVGRLLPRAQLEDRRLIAAATAHLYKIRRAKKAAARDRGGHCPAKKEQRPPRRPIHMPSPTPPPG